jgi:hypothetical protein
MKMLKSLLLGSAATLVAVTAGQAADLPVKAGYGAGGGGGLARACNMYGAGFYYMTGSDICIKIGGWTRAEATYGNNGNMTWGPFNANANLRTTSNLTFRARGYITADAREQTAYGVARGYIAVGLNTNDVGLQVASLVDSANRAYVQFAGITAGLAQSFYDFYAVPAYQYRGGYLPASDTGDGGWWVWGYTAQFGGGFSATLSAEARRTTQIIDAGCATSGGTTTPTCGSIAPGGFPSALTANGNATTGGALFPGNGAYGGQQAPDVIANLRVDQAWGAAQVMAAWHQVNASYYGTATTAAPNAASLAHPGDANGWAIGGGLKVNFPSFAPGDNFSSQVNYTKGAARYVFNTPNTNWGYVTGGSAGGNEAYGVLSDCVYDGTPAGGNTTGCQLTTAWGFNAAFEHYWTPAWHQSLYGAYAQVKYNSLGNGLLCVAEGAANGAGAGSTATAVPGCNNNWSTWGIGTRLQWDITKNTYIGVEALYEDLHSGTVVGGALGGTGLAVGGTGATTQVADQTNWAFTARIHKDFLP